MIPKGKLPGIIALIGKPKGSDDSDKGSSDPELDMCIKNLARCIKDGDTAGIEDGLHELVDCINDADDDSDKKPADEGADEDEA